VRRRSHEASARANLRGTPGGKMSEPQTKRIELRDGEVEALLNAQKPGDPSLHFAMGLGKSIPPAIFVREDDPATIRFLNEILVPLRTQNTTEEK
jgi:hypothetical protein